MVARCWHGVCIMIRDINQMRAGEMRYIIFILALCVVACSALESGSASAHRHHAAIAEAME